MKRALSLLVTAIMCCLPFSTIPPGVGLLANVNRANILWAAPPGERVIDVFTQRGGVGPSVRSGDFCLGETVFVYAYVTYNGDPIQSWVVTIQIFDSHHNPIGSRYPTTNSSGMANTTFTLPSNDPEYYVGDWTVSATADVYDVVVSDTLVFACNYPYRKLTVISCHDNPVPGVGDNYFSDGQSVTCSVTSLVTEDGTIWICTGFSGTGSVPVGGSSNNVTFAITQDSTITWTWCSNQPPTPPQFVSWPNVLPQNFQGTYKVFATDPDNDLVSITFDWGDGSQDTVGPGDSGSTQTGTHSFSYTGMYQVKTIATDTFGVESDWSGPEEVTVLTDTIRGNWGGYMVQSPNQPITSVDGQFYVPTFGAQTISKNAIWVGIGGSSPGNPFLSLLQAGVEADTNPDTNITDYRAFLEVIDLGIGHPTVVDPKTSGRWIFAGDAMDVSIQFLSGSNWEVQITDLTRGWTLTWSSVTWWFPDQKTAEWIFEPGADKTNMPSSFGTVIFDSATIGIGGSVFEMGKVGQTLSTELHNCTVPQNDPAITSLSPVENYENFEIFDTGNRPASQSLVPITSLSLHSAAELHVYDSSGNHLGYNSTTGFIDDQIPNSIFFEENGVQYAFLFAADTYSISVVGTQDGEYHLHTQIISNDVTTIDQWTNDTITVNETKTYTLLHQIGIEHVFSKTVIRSEQSSLVTINVTNCGNYFESFNVTLYANTTVIGTKLVNLRESSSTEISFTWNTSGFPVGNYVLSAIADVVPGENDTANNNCTRGPVTLTISGDLNADFNVDIYDAILLANSFGTSTGDAKFNPDADFKTDGTIDIYDAIILANNFACHVP